MKMVILVYLLNDGVRWAEAHHSFTEHLLWSPFRPIARKRQDGLEEGINVSFAYTDKHSFRDLFQKWANEYKTDMINLGTSLKAVNIFCTELKTVEEQEEIVETVRTLTQLEPTIL